MQRFFLNKEYSNEDSIIIEDENVNYIKNVLRYNIGEQIEIIFNNNDKIYIGEISTIDKSYILCNIVNVINKNTESPIYINLIQGLPKSDKMEWIVEKCTELGVKEITPLKLKRCVVKLDAKEEQKKIERWQKIALSAAEQSKRNIVPKINNIFNIDNLFNLTQNYDIVIVAYELEKENNLKKVLKNAKGKKIKIAVIVGPEGGLEEEEINRLREFNNAKIVSLGDRILRTETAGLAIITSIMYELGDFGGII